MSILLYFALLLQHARTHTHTHTHTYTHTHTCKPADTQTHIHNHTHTHTHTHTHLHCHQTHRALGARRTRGLSRRGPAAALALAVLALLLMAHGAHGAECTREGSLPCTFGGCTFSLDADQFLERTGSCADKWGTLYLTSKNIKGLREGVFDNMRACT